MRSQPFLIFLSLSCLASVSAHADSEAQGYPFAGRLKDGVQLAPEASSYVHVTSPTRAWGTRELVETIENVADQMLEAYWNNPDEFDILPFERLQIGDLSAERGGKISGHGSHQNGLDVDIGLLRMNRAEVSPIGFKEFVEEFVITVPVPSPATGRKKGQPRYVNTVTENFDIQRNWQVLQLFYRSERLQRAFIDRTIKSAFAREFLTDPTTREKYFRFESTKKSRAYNEFTQACESAGLMEICNILQTLSHEPIHKDHVHIRLKCPADDLSCNRPIRRQTKKRKR